jgi:antitoxin FitA
MNVSLSIKEVPDELAGALRERARRNHRSIQGELMSILVEAVEPKPFRAAALIREIQALGLSTPGHSAQLIRDTRDER